MKAMLQRTESERTMLAREYDIAMCGLPWGIGWPALWVAEDAYIEWSETPDAEVDMWPLPRCIPPIEWLYHSPSELSAHSGESDHRFQRKVITDSGAK